ncbi:sensor histidine kinase [Paenibacillus allorhizosphaerae]|nr:sensor histidine kinase [Paenibacillus allorhizosphaerae]
MLRLLIYIGAACTLILTGSVVFVYVQTASLVREQTEQQMRWTHGQIVQRMQHTVSELDRTIRFLASDYVVRRFAESGFSRETPEDAGIRDELDAMIRRQAAQFPYISELCVTQDQTGISLCNQTDPEGSALASRMLPAISRNERLLYAASDIPGRESDPVKELIYVMPITERGTSVVKGTVSLSLNVARMLKDTAGEQLLSGMIVYNDRGQLLYRYQAPGQPTVALPGHGNEQGSFDNWERGRFISQKLLDIPQAAWYSRAEITPPGLLSGRRNAVPLAFVFALTLIAAGGASAFLYRRYYQSPVEHLRQLMKRAERGDWKAYWVGKSSSLQELGDSYNQMLNRLEELIRQVKREEALKKEAEMEALQYQLNPHFLYNTLNTIKWVAKLHKTPQISEVVTALVRLLQASLGKKGDFITVKEEVGLLQDYMEIQRFRYGDKIRLECVVEAGANHCLLPCMLLQPLVENAIVHGIEPAKREGLIRVNVSLDPKRDLLICEVEDNGIGITEENTEKPDEETGGVRVRERMSGIGVRHIREKIKLYYGSGYHLHIIGKPGEGTVCRLTLPIHQSGG